MLLLAVLPGCLASETSSTVRMSMSAQPTIVVAAETDETPAKARTVADDLHAMVGARTRESSTQFALRTAAGLAGPLWPAVAAAGDAKALATVAATRSALVDGDTGVLPGDLLLLGDAVGVVIAVRAGTCEILYVSDRVVRRGFVTPSAPARKRDDDGHALNTFVRPYRKTDRAGQKYLAGELYGGALRLTRLLAR